MHKNSAAEDFPVAVAPGGKGDDARVDGKKDILWLGFVA